MKKRYITIITLCVILALLLTGCMPQNGEAGTAEVQISTAGNSTAPDNLEQNTDKEESAEPQAENPYGIDPAKPMVALTFDDGPSTNTQAILDILDKYDVKATFFVIGTAKLEYLPKIKKYQIYIYKMNFINRFSFNKQCSKFIFCIIR